MTPITIRYPHHVQDLVPAAVPRISACGSACGAAGL